MHTHKAIQAKQREQGWTECVTPHTCAARPNRASAHGGIVVVDVCRCGATRRTEVNGKASNRGEWIEQETL